MSSFFIKNKRNFPKKRKNELPGKEVNAKKQKAPKEESDEEIESDDDALDNNEDIGEIPSDPEEETAQDKRLRLAKQYLEEIEKEEQNRADDKELHDSVSRRLRDEYLDSVGKLRRNIADTIKGYKAATLKVLKNKRHKLPLTTVVLSNDGEFMFTGGKSSIVVKWNVANFQQVGFFDCEEYTEKINGKKRRPHILALSLSSDMKFLAVAEGGNIIQIWCPKTLKHIKTFTGHRDVVTCLTFRRDTHQLYSGAKDRSVKIWSLDEMSYIESLFGHQSAITGIDALSRERAITSGGTDRSIRIWKISEESQLIYNGHSGSIENVKLINDENFISSGDDGSLCVWSTLKKKPLCMVPLVHGKSSNGVANWISAIATLLNSDLIASGSCDGHIRIWKLSENGRKLKEMFTIPVAGFINSLAFTSSGSHLIAAVGQEHRLGRWWRLKDAKNSIVVIELNKIDSS